MEQIVVNSVSELRAVLERFNNGCLFRGQTSHYGEAGSPSVVTSFDRQGCIPSEMLKWSRYANSVLQAYLGPLADSGDFTQALLQHYGWRSFYIDLSSSPAVSAWFASHKYSENKSLEISEDYEERAVWLRKRMARYDFEDGEGHLYVIEKSVAAEAGLIDLNVLKLEGYRPRTDAQAAWLLGPLRNKPVPLDCFRARITASRAVFRDFAAEEGLTGTDRLFPPPAEDPLLYALLGLPWKEIPGVRTKDFNLPAFRRALELPEYQDSFVKINWSRTAFFCGTRIADKFKTIDGDKIGGIVVNVPDTVLYGVADDDTPMRFPEVEALVAQHGTVTFEIDDLLQHTTMGHLTLYQKGIAVMPHGPDLMEICPVMVEHPGMDMTAAGLGKGWYYRVGPDGLWQREVHPDQCDCGNASAHTPHVSALHIAEHFLFFPQEHDEGN